MKNYKLDNVKLLVTDGDQVSRRSTVETLRNLGFRQIEQADSLEAVQSMAEMSTPPDLMLIEVAPPGNDVGDWIHAFRHNRFGNDPFTPIIGITWKPTEELVGNLLKGGTDNLLQRPISGTALMASIKTIIEKRKPFVVTSDYVGPDRRKEIRNSDSSEFLDVPNRLQLKAEGQAVDGKVSAQYKLALGHINDRKLERYAHELKDKVEELIFSYSSKTGLDRVPDMLNRLLWLADDGTERVASSPYAHMAELLETTKAVVTALIKSHPTPLQKDLDLLHNLGEAAAQGFSSTAARDVQALKGISRVVANAEV